MKSPVRSKRRGAQRGVDRQPLGERLKGLLAIAFGVIKVMVVSAFVWGIYSGYRYLDAPVEVIVIKGDYSNVTQSALAGWVEPLLQGQGGMLSLDLEVMQRGVEQHPWVAQARISRQWPDSLIVQVVEEEPVARWGQSGFLSSRGEALSIEDNSGLQQLPLLSGPQGMEKAVMQRYRDVAEMLEGEGLTVEGVSLSERGNWRVALKEAPELVLGKGELRGKIERFVVVWQQVLKNKIDQIAGLDLRYDNGVAVKWRQPEQV